MIQRLPIPGTVLAAVLALYIAAPSSAVALNGGNFGAHLTITSDYVFRGVSQTRGGPAVQGGIDFRHRSGFFAGIWGSNVDFPSNRGREEPRTLELDYFLGFELGLGRDWSSTASLIRYDYPGSGAVFDYSYNEVSLSLSFQESLEGLVAYTDSAFGSGRPGYHYELLGDWPAPYGSDLVAGVGYADLDRAFGRSYTYWNLVISRRVRRFTFDLGWFDNSSRARELWGDLAGGRLVVSISADLD